MVSSVGIHDVIARQRSIAGVFRNQQVLLAMEGSRHFRAPEGFGWFPFEGCTILVFADDLGERADAFLNSASGSAFGVEEIEGLKILVFEQRVESGLWTTFVAFKKPSILLVATNLDYLREVLRECETTAGHGRCRKPCRSGNM